MAFLKESRENGACKCENKDNLPSNQSNLLVLTKCCHYMWITFVRGYHELVSHGPNLVLEDVNISFFLFSLHRPIWEMRYISFSLLVAIVK